MKLPNRLPPRLPLAILFLTLVVAFYRLFLGEVFFWGLPALQFYPWREYAFETLWAGQLPLWNPYNGAGAPLLANYQSALFYPPNWLSAFLPLSHTMSIVAVAHLFIAGWGMWMFSGRLGVPTLGRGISALAFGMTSYLVARLGTFPVITAAAWLPWMMWAVLGVFTHSKIRDYAWLALFAALTLLAGHAQTAWYSFLLTGLYVLWRWLRYERSMWRRMAFLAGAVILGAGVAAVQLISTAELLSQSQRSGGVDYEFAVNFSYGRARTVNFLQPNVFGNPGDGSFVTRGAFFEDAVYIGFIPLVGAFAALVGWLWWRRKPERPVFFSDVPFWWLVVIIAYVLALGENSPVFPFLFRNVPTFDAFQAPVRWHLWTVFGLSVLAGIGTQSWGRGKWVFYFTRLLTASALCAGLLAWYGTPRLLSPDALENAGIRVLVNAFIAFSAVGVAAGVLTLGQPERDKRAYSWWALLVLLVVAFDVGWAARGLNPTIPPTFYEQNTERPSGRAYWAEPIERQVKFEDILRFDDYSVAQDNPALFRQSELPNLNLLDREYLLNNFDPLQVGHHADYIDLIEEAGFARRVPLLLLAGVSETYSWKGERFPLLLPADADPPTRAYLVDVACWHESEESLREALLQPSPENRLHILGDGECPASSEAPGEVLMTQDDGNAIEITVNTAGSGWLVLADTHYPGWRATVDGTPRYIYRANLAFRAVQVQRGDEVVRFVYRPWWVLPGFVVSVVSIIGLLFLFRWREPAPSE